MDIDEAALLERCRQGDVAAFEPLVEKYRERVWRLAYHHLRDSEEARDVVARPVADGVVRLGIPEDFAAYRLAELLSDFARARPTLRLDVSCGRSVVHKHALDVGELDIALYKRNAGDGDAIAAWPERLQWVTSRVHPVNLKRDPIPLVVMEQGCLYRNRLIHAIETAGRTWHIAYTSPNLPGIQAAVSAGLGVSMLPDVAILPEHKIITQTGFPPITNTELALVVADHASPATRHLAEVLAEFCSNFDPRDGGGFQSGKQRLAANA